MYHVYEQYRINAEKTLVEDVRKTIITDFSNSLRYRRQLIANYFPDTFDEEYDFVWLETKTAKFIWQSYKFIFYEEPQRFSILQPFSVEGMLCFNVSGVEIKKNVSFDLIFDLKLLGWSTDENSGKKVSWNIFQPYFRMYTFDQTNYIQSLPTNFNFFQSVEDENKRLKSLI